MEKSSNLSKDTADMKVEARLEPWSDSNLHCLSVLYIYTEHRNGTNEMTPPAYHLSPPLCVNHLYHVLETTMEHLIATNSYKLEWGVVGFLPAYLSSSIY